MIGAEKGAVWVLAEFLDGRILEVSIQLVGRARGLADELEVPVGVILLGSEIGEQAELLFHLGADVVFLGDGPEFAQYQSELFAAVVVSLALENQPQILLIGSTFMGRELAPIVAAKLQTGLTAHCVDLTLGQNHVLEQWVPAYGGMVCIICPDKRPQMATVSKGVFPTPLRDGGRTGRFVRIMPPTEITLRTEALEIVTEEPIGVNLEDAATVIAGGAGAGNLDGWQEIVQLAQVLQAALGSTRPAVDEGWTELDTMIGQSGKVVQPDLYIGVGVSGELQHMVGVVGAKEMIAINNDPKSPIFEQVDYGIIADCRQFLPILIEKLKLYKGHKGSG